MRLCARLLNVSLFVFLLPRTRWKCAHGRMSLRAFCLPCATFTLWWQRGGNLVLRVGTDRTPLTPGTSLFPSTSSTTTWKQILRYTCFCFSSIAVQRITTAAVCNLNWKPEHMRPELDTTGHLLAKQRLLALWFPGAVRWPALPVWWDHVWGSHHRRLGPPPVSDLPGGVCQARDDGGRAVPGTWFPFAWKHGL